MIIPFCVVNYVNSVYLRKCVMRIYVDDPEQLIIRIIVQIVIPDTTLANIDICSPGIRTA